MADLLGHYDGHRFSPLGRDHAGQRGPLRPAWVYQAQEAGGLQTHAAGGRRRDVRHRGAQSSRRARRPHGTHAVALRAVHPEHGARHRLRPVQPRGRAAGRIASTWARSTRVSSRSMRCWAPCAGTRRSPTTRSATRSRGAAGHAGRSSSASVAARRVSAASLMPTTQRPAIALWRFYTVPGPGEPGHDTWQGDSWKTGGGSTWLTWQLRPRS